MTDPAPAMSVTQCDNVRKLPRGVEHYRSRFSHSVSLAYAASAAESALAEAWTKDQAAHEANAPAIAHNQAMRDRITQIMKTAGVPDHYDAPKPGSRAWPPKKIKVEAGYLGDIRRAFVIADQFDDAVKQQADRAKLIAEAKTKAESEKADREREAEDRKTKRRADLALAAIIVRYQLAEEADWPDALDALRKRNKYLDLAIAGERTRIDCSDGFYRVEASLKRFTIDSDRDKDIVADLCGCLRQRDEGENDGRIFRDTTWSYDRLFDLVEDKQLLADTKACLEHVST